MSSEYKTTTCVEVINVCRAETVDQISKAVGDFSEMNGLNTIYNGETVLAMLRFKHSPEDEAAVDNALALGRVDRRCLDKTIGEVG